MRLPILLLIVLQCFLALPHLALAVDRLEHILLKEGSIVFEALSFTSSRCKALLTSIRIESFPAPRKTSSDPPRVMPASYITLNSPTNENPCGAGELTFFDESIPAKATMSSKPYSLFLRVTRELFPIRFMSYSDGIVSSCPVSQSQEEPASEGLTSILFFTPKGNKSKLSAPAGNGGRDLFIANLAEDVVYVSVAFVEMGDELDRLKKGEQREPGDVPVDFYCILASNTEKAEAALAAGLPGTEEETSKKSENVTSGTPKSRRRFSAGEAVGIGVGALLALLGFVGLGASRRKKSPEPTSAGMPRGL